MDECGLTHRQIQKLINGEKIDVSFDTPGEFGSVDKCRVKLVPIKMDECKLNLGPFNDCVYVVKEGVTPEYCVNGEIIQAPTKVYGLAINSDTSANRKKLKNAIELAVINTIYEIIQSERLDIVSLLKRVKIPFVSSKFHIDHKDRLCITAIFGVAIFDDDQKSDCEEVY